MKKALILSSHLDDAILSAGQFIAGRGDCDVLTVFSGIPMKNKLLTDYDKSCGFKTSKDAMVVRRQEDMEACAILNARPIHTKRLDSQYYNSEDSVYLPDLVELEEFIKKGKYEKVIAPLGLNHPDHILLSETILRFELKNLYLYEDLPHRVTHPELVFERLERLRDDLLHELELEFIGDGPIADKIRALWCYRSQMNRGDLNPYNLYVPERFWHVTS